MQVIKLISYTKLLKRIKHKTYETVVQELRKTNFTMPQQR